MTDKRPLYPDFDGAAPPSSDRLQAKGELPHYDASHHFMFGWIERDPAPPRDHSDDAVFLSELPQSDTERDSVWRRIVMNCPPPAERRELFAEWSGARSSVERMCREPEPGPDTFRLVLRDGTVLLETRDPRAFRAGARLLADGNVIVYLGWAFGSPLTGPR